VPDVLVYHLETQPLERVIPVLLEKTLERGWRAIVEVGSGERAELLDRALWVFRDDGFLPHGLSGGEFDADQPVLLTTGPQNGNGAEVRFFADRAVPQSAEGYQRVVYLFSGRDPDAVVEAREAWKALRTVAENALTYWQQDESGRWIKRG
jgi:DNA polymerase-3 subunit chi